MHEVDDNVSLATPLADEAATLAFGAKLAAGLVPGLTLYLEGDLGAGKTTLVRGMLRALGYTGRVKSPTYTLAESYDLGRFELYHFDLYRLHDPREWLDAGFRDLDDAHTVRVIEWPEKAAGWLPAPDLVLTLHIPDEGRALECKAASPRGVRFLEDTCASC